MLRTLRARNADQTSQEGVESKEEGFTLIELMVVVLIIAILIAIAIPTFFGAQEKARKSAAQSNLRNAISSVKVLAADYEGQFLKPDGAGSTTTADFAFIQQNEKAIKWVDGSGATVPTAGQVGVLVVDSDNLRVWAQAKSTEWFGVLLQSTGAIGYCKATSSADIKTTTCDSDSWETAGATTTTVP